MYDPLKQVDKAFRKGPSSEKFKRVRPHPILSGFELAAFFSFLPGLYIFLYGFLLSAAATFVAHETEKGRYVFSALLLVIGNLLPTIIGTMVLITEEYYPQALTLAVVFGGLTIWGFLAIYYQRKMMLNMPPVTDDI